MYAVTATMFVNPSSGSAGPDYNAVLTAERLSKTYQKLAKNRTVLDQVIQDLQLPMSTSALSNKISAQADGETQLLSIVVSDTDPNRAAAIANTVATRFQEYVVDDLSSSSAADLDSLTNLMKEMEAEIADVQGQIQRLQAQPNADDPAVKAQVDALTARLEE